MPVGWPVERVKAAFAAECEQHAPQPKDNLLAQVRQANLYCLALTIEQCGVRERQRLCKCGADLGAVKHYCHQHLCLSCQRYKAYKIAKEFEAVLAELRKTYPGLKILWGTFTLPSCHAEALGARIKALIDGFAKLLRRAPLKAHIIGAVRVVEFAFNREAQSFHAHLHALIVVKASYLSKGYLSQQAWLGLWQEATQCSSATQVSLKRINPDAKRSLSLETNAAELVRYALKPIVPAQWTPAGLTVLVQATRNRRLCEFLGALRPIRKQLKEAKPRCLCQNCLARDHSQ